MADLFRKEALDTIATPEQLDRQIRIMRPATWALCGVFVIGIITFILWSVMYRISSGINMNGVIFTNNNVVQNRVRRDCTVTDVLVSDGEHVDMGDIIAVVSYDELLDDIAEARAGLAGLDGEALAAASAQADALVDNYIASTVIKSGSSGYIQSVAGNGSALKTGDRLYSVMPDSGYDEVIAYVPLQTAQNISPGMEVQVSPAHAPREEYGYMTGNITSVGDTPVTEDGIIETMGTMSYVENILPDSSFIEVRIRLDIDPDSDNNYKWSNEKGEQVSVELGTQCSIMVITDEYRPIELLTD